MRQQVLIPAMSPGHSEIMSPAVPRLCRPLEASCWRVGFWREASCRSILCGWSQSGAAQAVAGKIDAMGVVDEAVENGVGIGWVADDLVPFVDRDLAGQDGRAAAIAFFEDLVEIAAGTGVERFEAPIVEDQELGAIEAAHDAGMTSVTARQGEIGEELGDAVIEH